MADELAHRAESMRRLHPDDSRFCQLIRCKEMATGKVLRSFTRNGVTRMRWVYRCEKHLHNDGKVPGEGGGS
jgi:hypothetical protein